MMLPLNAILFHLAYEKKIFGIDRQKKKGFVFYTSLKQLVHKIRPLFLDIVFQYNKMQAILMFEYHMDYVEKPFFLNRKDNI